MKRTRPSSEDAQGQIGRDDPVRSIHDLADLQVNRRSTEAKGLLSRHVVLGRQVIDHVANGLLRIGKEVRAVRRCHEIACLIGHRKLLARRCDEAQFGNAHPLAQGKGQRHRHEGFDARPVHFAITLG